MSAFVTALFLVENWRAEITAGSAVSGAKDVSRNPSFLVKTFSNISVSWRKRREADSLSCHLTGVTFDVLMAADPLVVSVTGEAVQPSGLEKPEPLKGET